MASLVYWKDETLYVNPSSQCMNDCLFCVRVFKEGVYGFQLRMEKDPTPNQLLQALRNIELEDFDEAAVVGFGEPLLNLDATLASIKYLSSRGMPVRMNSNGQAGILYPERDVAKELDEAGLDEIQISLNAPDAKTYAKLCQPVHGEEAFLSLLDFAEDCNKYMQTVFSVVRIPGLDIDACRELAREYEIPLRIRDFKGSFELLQEIASILDE